MEQEYAKELDSLDILEPNPKIDLWLAYKGIKPVSIVYELTSSKTIKNKLLDWCKKVGLYIEKNADTANYVVGKNELLVKEVNESLLKTTEEAIIRKCELLGYPVETALSACRNFLPDNDKYPKGISISNNFFESKIPWWEYVRYIVREGHEVEDSLVAKKWHDTIEKDLPKTHKLFIEDLRKNKS